MGTHQDEQFRKFQQEWADWARSGNLDGMREALQEGQEIDETFDLLRADDWDSHFKAAPQKYSFLVEAFLSKPYPLHGLRAASVAAREDNLAVLDFLKENSAKMDALDLHGYSPLMWACAFGRKNASGRLVNLCRSNPNQKGASGLTALHFAALFGHPDLITFLASKGGDINAKDDAGNTPLHLSMLCRNPNAVKTLMALEADREVENKDGKTAEKMPGGLSANRSVLKGEDGGFGSFGMGSLPPGFAAIAAAKPPPSSSSGSSAPSLALPPGAAEQIAAHFCALVNSATDASCSAAEQAENARELEKISDAFEEWGQSSALDAIDPASGHTFLSICAEKNLHELAESLLQAGAKASVPNVRADTPLHCAAQADSAETLQILLSWGADSKAMNQVGQTPAQVAQGAGHSGLQMKLESSSAHSTPANVKGLSLSAPMDAPAPVAPKAESGAGSASESWVCAQAPADAQESARDMVQNLLDDFDSDLFLRKAPKIDSTAIANQFVFAVAPGDDEQPCWIITPKTYWEKEQAVFDQEIPLEFLLPDGAEDVNGCGSWFLHSDQDPVRVARDLLSRGFELDEKLQAFMDGVSSTSAAPAFGQTLLAPIFEARALQSHTPAGAAPGAKPKL